MLLHLFTFRDDSCRRIHCFRENSPFLFILHQHLLCNRPRGVRPFSRTKPAAVPQLPQSASIRSAAGYQQPDSMIL
jgi:hypothetical protein